MQTQVIMEFARRSPLDSDELDNLADACLEALNRHGRFLAFGPVVSVEYPRSAIEVECIVCTETQDEIDGVIERILGIVRGALAAADYATSAERVPVPA